MPPDNNRQRLDHMLAVANELLHFTRGKSYDDLLADRGLQYICIHCLELIGEAASCLTVEIRDEHPDVPWRPIISMRNRLIHGYFDIELSFVWSTITVDIPALIPQLHELLAEES